MNFELTDELRAAIIEHAGQEQPREACGLIARTGGVVQYLTSQNMAAKGDQFMLDPDMMVMAEEANYELLAVVHSHPNASANPSMADRLNCEKSGLPWVIVGWPSGVFKTIEPEGWTAPYKGREFHHGVLDCYTLVQDWYRRELHIDLPDYERDDGWWESRADHPTQDLYMQQFSDAGFVRVFGEPQRHDGILMQVRADVANHAAVYTGDGVMLHHLHGRLSEETLYGGYWQRHTLALVRHISRLTPAQAQAAMQAAA
jgi:proteasome lid subunit RPN8/RPN11